MQWQRWSLLRPVAIAVVFLAGIAVGSSINGRSVFVSPGEATRAQIQEVVDEMSQMVNEQRLSQQRMDELVHELRCRYLPDEEEGCDE